MPTLISGHLYTDDEFTGTHVGSARWWQWLEAGHSFHYWGGTYRAERRRQGLSWYAFKRSGGVLYKVYVGRSAALDINRLVDSHVDLMTRCRGE